MEMFALYFAVCLAEKDSGLVFDWTKLWFDKRIKWWLWSLPTTYQPADRVSDKLDDQLSVWGTEWQTIWQRDGWGAWTSDSLMLKTQRDWQTKWWTDVSFFLGDMRIFFYCLLSDFFYLHWSHDPFRFYLSLTFPLTIYALSPAGLSQVRQRMTERTTEWWYRHKRLIDEQQGLFRFATPRNRGAG